MQILYECGHGSDCIGITCCMSWVWYGASDSPCWYGEHVQITGWVHGSCEDVLAIHCSHLHLVPVETDLATGLAQFWY